MTAHRPLMLAVFLTVAPFVGKPAAADPILDFTGGTAGLASFDATLGWKFTVAAGSTITIGGLGIFDTGGDGLKEDHVIALWACGTGCNSDGSSVLASTTITNANSTSVPSTSTSGSTAGTWRAISITSLQLNPGDYVVGAFYKKDSPDGIVLNSTASTISGVTWDEYRAATGAAFPTSFTTEAGGKGFFGPNLFTPTKPVPEPKTYAMLMAGLGLLGFIAHRRRKLLNAAA